MTNFKLIGSFAYLLEEKVLKYLHTRKSRNNRIWSQMAFFLFRVCHQTNQQQDKSLLTGFPSTAISNAGSMRRPNLLKISMPLNSSAVSKLTTCSFSKVWHSGAYVSFFKDYLCPVKQTGQTPAFTSSKLLSWSNTKHMYPVGHWRLWYCYKEGMQVCGQPGRLGGCQEA